MMDLKQALDDVCDCEYPADVGDIERRCEGVVVEFQDGSETTLGEMLDTLDDPPEEFKSRDGLRSLLMSLAPQGSVGRVYYDDRGATQNDREQQSL